jgi:protocatechuate 3,4-dioxygenase beta subunit
MIRVAVSKRDWRVHPPYLHEAYTSTVRRSPRRPLVPLEPSLSELTGPAFGADAVHRDDADLTRIPGRTGEAIGQRIYVTGRVLEEEGRPVANALVEVWQANAAGRYFHKVDRHDAPLDPNFTGGGRCLTDARGEYRFTTIHPGAYPWTNHPNAWRPAHIHFSVFGPAFLTRLVTQMYFPGDALLPFDPIFNSIPDERARSLLISSFDWESTMPAHALGYRFDIVLRGRDATPIQR